MKPTIDIDKVKTQWTDFNKYKQICKILKDICE